MSETPGMETPKTQPEVLQGSAPFEPTAPAVAATAGTPGALQSSVSTVTLHEGPLGKSIFVAVGDGYSGYYAVEGIFRKKSNALIR